MIREHRLIKEITIKIVKHRIARLADDTQLMSEGNAITFAQSSTADVFGGKSGLAMNSRKTQAVWLGSERWSLAKYLPQIKMDWNQPKFKILCV